MGRISDARERLLAAASDLIHDRGYTAVGVGDVCERAQVNKGSFYHFFQSKHELALAVLETYWNDHRDRIARSTATPGRALSKLLCMLDGMPDAHASSSGPDGKYRGCSLGNLALELSTQDDAIRGQLDSIFRSWSSRLADLVRDAVKDGDLPEQDPDQAGLGLVALIEGYVMLAKTANDPKVLRQVGIQGRRMLGIPPKATCEGSCSLK